MNFVLFCGVIVLGIAFILKSIAYRRLSKDYNDLLDKYLTLISCHPYH